MKIPGLLSLLATSLPPPACEGGLLDQNFRRLASTQEPDPGH